MSAWTLWTWISVAILIAGPVAVFAWFLRDARRVFRDIGVAERDDGARANRSGEG